MAWGRGAGTGPRGGGGVSEVWCETVSWRKTELRAGVLQMMRLDMQSVVLL